MADARFSSTVSGNIADGNCTQYNGHQIENLTIEENHGNRIENLRVYQAQTSNQVYVEILTSSISTEISYWCRSVRNLHLSIHQHLYIRNDAQFLNCLGASQPLGDGATLGSNGIPHFGPPSRPRFAPAEARRDRPASVGPSLEYLHLIPPPRSKTPQLNIKDRPNTKSLDSSKAPTMLIRVRRGLV